MEPIEADRDKVEAVLQRVRAEGRATIGDAEARDILEAYGIPLPKSVVAATPEEAVTAAESIGYPVVMKIASPDILHKTDIGAVKLNINSAGEVRDAFDLLVYRSKRHMPDATIWGCQIQQMVKGGREVIIGMNRDPQFGPLLMYGLGGIYVEALKDVTFRVAPIDRREAREMLPRSARSTCCAACAAKNRPTWKVWPTRSFASRSSSPTFLEIVELDINPLMVFAAGQGVLGIDARLALQV